MLPNWQSYANVDLVGSIVARMVETSPIAEILFKIMG